MMERKRLLAAALGLLALVFGFLAYRRLSPASLAGAPQPVVFSADGLARMSSVLRRFSALLGRGSGRPLSADDARRALASASGDPVARRFAEQFMAEPVLRKAWERHRHDEDAKGFVNEVIETPELAKLLDQWQDDPRFLGLAERTAGAMEAEIDQRSASADRMIMTADVAPPPPEPARAAPVLSRPRRGAPSSFAANMARFKSIFSLMPREPRDRVLAQLEQGLPVREACGRAGAAKECDAALERCEGDEGCARWLKQNEGAGGGGPGKKDVVVLRGEERPEAEDVPSEEAPPKKKSGGGGGRDDDDDDRPTQPRNPFAGMNLGGKGSPPAKKSPPPPKPKPDPDCYVPRNCFAAGTRVLTPAGEVPIETIRTGDAVLSLDLDGGALVSATVLKTFKSEAKGLRRVTFSNGLELRVTEEHPFFDPGTGGFRRVRELSAGDRVGRLFDSAGLVPAAPLAGAFHRPGPPAAWSPAAGLLETLTVAGIEELPSEGVPVYNFHVGERQNYFAEGILVHNRKVCAE